MIRKPLDASHGAYLFADFLLYSCGYGDHHQQAIQF
jgi:hypothetical protein